MAESTLARQTPPGTSRAVVEIQELDLSMVKRKLQHAEEGMDWDERQAEEAIAWYRKFLVLHVLYPRAQIVPTGMIDAVWHQHILDTRAYASDTKRIFGKFLHHYPYFGLNGDEDERALRAAFDDTCRLFNDEFGVSPDQARGCKKCRQCRGCKHRVG